MRVLLAAVALLALLPGVAAQDLGMEFAITSITVEKEALVPDVDVSPIEVAWSITCKGTASQPHGLLVPSSLIQFDQPMTPLGVVVTGALTTATPAPDCVTRMQVTGTSPFSVSASQDALGEVPLAIRFAATLKSPHEATVDDLRAAPSNATVTVAYLGRLTANVPETIQRGAAGEALVYHVELTNLGNAPSILHFAAVGSLPLHGRLELPPPTVIPLDGTVVVPVKYHAETAGEAESFAIQVTPRSTRTDAAGTTIQVNLLARIAPDAAPAATRDSPMVPPGAAALGLLAVAAVLRRR